MVLVHAAGEQDIDDRRAVVRDDVVVDRDGVPSGSTARHRRLNAGVEIVVGAVVMELDPVGGDVEALDEGDSAVVSVGIARGVTEDVEIGSRTTIEGITGLILGRVTGVALKRVVLVTADQRVRGILRPHVGRGIRQVAAVDVVGPAATEDAGESGIQVVGPHHDRGGSCQDHRVEVGDMGKIAVVDRAGGVDPERVIAVVTSEQGIGTDQILVIDADEGTRVVGAPVSDRVIGDIDVETVTGIPSVSLVPTRSGSTPPGGNLGDRVTTGSAKDGRKTAVIDISPIVGLRVIEAVVGIVAVIEVGAVLVVLVLRVVVLGVEAEVDRMRNTLRGRSET